MLCDFRGACPSRSVNLACLRLHVPARVHVICPVKKMQDSARARPSAARWFLPYCWKKTLPALTQQRALAVGVMHRRCEHSRSHILGSLQRARRQVGARNDIEDAQFQAVPVTDLTTPMITRSYEADHLASILDGPLRARLPRTPPC